MNHHQVIAWVLSVCTGCLRKSQAKTLSVLVAGAVRLQRVSLANLGRNLAGPVSAKHKIKRAWRFVANERVGIHDAMTGVLELLGKRWRREYRKKPLLVTFDWTDLRGLQTLMACAVVKGRSVPLIWASCSRNTWEGHQSRNAFEEALLLLLRDLLPKALGLEIVILADRGFGRTELGRFCQHQGFHYVIRIQPKVMIQVGAQKVRLDRYPVQKGQCFKLPGVLYRQRDPVTQHIVVRWKKGLPRRRDEAWYLMTDLPQGARALSDLYGKRMEIEEFFRDVKNQRAGWSLRDTLLTDPDRLDRLILILAIAYLLLIGLGLYAAQRHRPGRWCSNQRPESLSAFTIGQCELLLSHVPIPRLLTALLAAAANASGKWG
jgi:Transposase DDE domain